MKNHAVLSVLGRDRVGVVDDLASILGERGLDIESSSMTALEGQFAILARVSGEEDRVRSLQRDLATLSTSLQFHLQLTSLGFARTAAQAGRASGPPGRLELRIEAFAAKPAGLNAITGILRSHHVNIEELRTEILADPAPEVTLHLTARLTAPDSCSIDRLRSELHELELDRDVDIRIEPATRLRQPEEVTGVRSQPV